MVKGKFRNESKQIDILSAIKRLFPLSLKRFLRAKLRLEPLQIIMRKIMEKNIDFRDLDALEVFGFTGEYHTIIYAPFVRSLEVWEIDNNCETKLKVNLPDAIVKITDSYKEIKKTSKRFDLIVIDNPISICEGHCEHFDLFPDVFSVAKDNAIFIIDVIPQVTSVDIRNYPGLFDKKHLEIRSRFYEAVNPAHLLQKEIADTYKHLCEANNFSLEWYFFQRKTSVYYFVCGMKRTAN